MTFSLTWMKQVLQSAGVSVSEVAGWQTRGHGNFGEPMGVMIHHTVSDPPANLPSLDIVTTQGNGETAAPLCNLLVGRDGSFHLIAAGRAYHAGDGSYSGVTDGNANMIGIEAENNGRGERWPDVQIQAMQKATAALLRYMRKPATMCCGHKEWRPGGKVDPTFDMNAFRSGVASLMQGGEAAPVYAPERQLGPGQIGLTGLFTNVGGLEGVDPNAPAGGGGGGGGGGAGDGDEAPTSGCAARWGISAAEATQIENEGLLNPFGDSADGQALQRMANGTTDMSANPMAAPDNGASAAGNLSCGDIPADAPDSFRLGRNFTVGMLSSQAPLPHRLPARTRLGIPRATIICRMRHLVTNCLDPLVEGLQQRGYRVQVSSGFRNNTNGSDHNRGSAADLMIFKNSRRVTGSELSLVVKIINEELRLPFTQMIEEASRLIHVACRPEGNSATRLYWSTGFGSPVSGTGYRHRV